MDGKPKQKIHDKGKRERYKISFFSYSQSFLFFFHLVNGDDLSQAKTKKKDKNLIFFFFLTKIKNKKNLKK